MKLKAATYLSPDTDSLSYILITGGGDYGGNTSMAHTQPLEQTQEIVILGADMRLQRASDTT